jgi:hypothetical protein
VSGIVMVLFVVIFFILLFAIADECRRRRSMARWLPRLGSLSQRSLRKPTYWEGEPTSCFPCYVVTSAGFYSGEKYHALGSLVAAVRIDHPEAMPVYVFDPDGKIWRDLSKKRGYSRDGYILLPVEREVAIRRI